MCAYVAYLAEAVQIQSGRLWHSPPTVCLNNWTLQSKEVKRRYASLSRCTTDSFYGTQHLFVYEYELLTLVYWILDRQLSQHHLLSHGTTLLATTGSKYFSNINLLHCSVSSRYSLEVGKTRVGKPGIGKLILSPSVLLSSCWIAVATTTAQWWSLSKQRGARALLYKGYKYAINRQGRDDRIFWRCAKSCTCSGSLRTMDDQIVSKKNIHNHPPDEAETKVKK